MKWACLKVGDVPTKGHHAEDNHDQAVHLGTLFPDPNGAEIYKTAVDPPKVFQPLWKLQVRHSMVESILGNDFKSIWTP